MSPFDQRPHPKAHYQPMIESRYGSQGQPLWSLVIQRIGQHQATVAVAAVAITAALVAGLIIISSNGSDQPGGMNLATENLEDQPTPSSTNPSALATAADQANQAAPNQPAVVHNAPNLLTSSTLPTEPTSETVINPPTTAAIPNSSDTSPAGNETSNQTLASLAPTTAAAKSSTTLAPTTAAPTTAAPTTQAPATTPTTPAPTTAAPTTQAPKPVDASMAQQILTITNDERAKNGCGPLTLNTKLNQAAQGHSQDMKDRQFFSHTNPDGEGPGGRIDATSYRWRAYGENIAYGYRDAATVMTGWMNSPGHRANIVNCRYTELGVGYVADGRYYTQVFGTPR